MKKLLDVLLGLGYVIWDLLVSVTVIAKDTIMLTLSAPREDNQFLRLLASESFWVDIVIFMIIFYSIGMFSLTVAVIITFFSFFYIDNLKTLYWKRRNSTFKSDSIGAAAIATFVWMVAIVVHTNNFYPYQYEMVGPVNLTQTTLDNAKGIPRKIEFSHDNTLRGLEIGDCQPGLATVIKQRLEPFWFNIIKEDYVLNCSGETKTNKILEVSKG